MKNKYISNYAIALMLTILLVVTGCGGDSSANKTKILKLSFNQTMENPEAMAMVYFSEKFNEATDGRYTIEIYPSEQLGGQQQYDLSLKTQRRVAQMTAVISSVMS